LFAFPVFYVSVIASTPTGMETDDVYWVLPETIVGEHQLVFQYLQEGIPILTTAAMCFEKYHHTQYCGRVFYW